MDSYNVIITEHAYKQLESYINYIQFTLMNTQAAKGLVDDAEETMNRLEMLAESLGFCNDPVLREQGFRYIKFKRYKYLMIYRIEEDTVFVEAVYHQMQDYESSIAMDAEDD